MHVSAPRRSLMTPLHSTYRQTQKWNEGEPLCEPVCMQQAYDNSVRMPDDALAHVLGTKKGMLTRKRAVKLGKLVRKGSNILGWLGCCRVRVARFAVCKHNSTHHPGRGHIRSPPGQYLHPSLSLLSTFHAYSSFLCSANNSFLTSVPALEARSAAQA